MKPIICTFLFIVSFVLSGCKEEVRSTWAQSPLKIDGDIEEWKDAPFVIFEDGRLALSVENDSAYLYLACRIGDATLQRMIDRLGLTLWVDPEGESSEDLEIHFPAGRSAELRLSRGGFWDNLTEEQKARTSKQIEEMRTGILVYDKRGVESHVYPSRSARGFAAGSAMSNGLLIYEFRIPLDTQKFFSRAGALGTQGKVGIGVKLSGLRERQIGSSSGGSGRAIGPPGRRGRGGGGGENRPPIGGESGDRTSDVWVSVWLAGAK